MKAIAMAVVSLAILAIFLEAFFYKRLSGRSYDWREAITSFGVAVGQRAVRGLQGGVVVAAGAWVGTYRIGEIPMDTPLAWVALFFLNELTYYWMHRMSHEVRWLWATHAVHHTPHQLTLSASYRLGWTGVISGTWLFWMPLIYLGFPAAAVFGMMGFNLVYQFWLHTELVPKLGGIERLFNTPSNHRVHHARNDEYLDKNFGGVIMLFDKLFGTYAEERAAVPCEYGVVNRPKSLNPIRIALTEVVELGKDVVHARSFKEMARLLFGRPGAHYGKGRRAAG